MAEQRVKLNVGGSRFETTLSTLTRHPDSMLAVMFSGRHEVPQDDDGYVFIDRDGAHFRIILNFLRDGVLDVPASQKAVIELTRELQYYQLPCDPAAMQPWPVTKPPAVEVVDTAGAAGEWSGESDSTGLPLNVEAHVAELQQKLKANPDLRVIASNIYTAQCDYNSDRQEFNRIVTTLASGPTH